MNVPSGEIHLWTQTLAVSQRQLEILAECLSEDEIQRSQRFHFEIHRNRFIAARGQLRHLLASYLEVKPTDIAFTYNAFGKPALASTDESLRFNLSHSEDLAVYAISQSREVGIDVEQVRERHADERIPEMFFSRSEVETLRALAPSLQTEAFFRCWTRKEAYVKARAEGLSIPLDSFDVTLRPEDPPKFLRGGDGYSIQSFEVEPDFIGAIVAEGEHFAILLNR